MRSGAPTPFSKNSDTEDEIDVPSASPILIDEISIDKVFDILPLYGRIDPGQEIATTIVFVGHSNLTAQCRAVCDVVGGPQYELNISGKSSFLDFQFSAEEIDFGKVLFDRLCQLGCPLVSGIAIYLFWMKID